MKLLIVSDSHGAVRHICQALERETPDVLIHLGDGWADAERIALARPDSCIRQVPGNCDHREDTPEELLLEWEGCRLLICHGHTYGVKRDLRQAMETAREKDLDGFFFGHTHRPLVEHQGKTLFLNPGSIGYGPKPTYAVATVDKGHLTAQTVYLHRS